MELDAGGALGHVSYLCSRSEPPVFVPLISKELDLLPHQKWFGLGRYIRL